MQKIEVGKCVEILKKNEIQPEVLRRVVEEINLAVQPNPGDAEKPPAEKKQFVILVSDPNGTMPAESLAGWVLQIHENENVATTQERIARAAYEYNRSRKGRLYPVKTVGEALDLIPAKHFREADVWIKTKQPVLVITTNNDIPKYYAP